MTQEEYKQGEALSHELLDWMMSKEVSSSMMLVVLVKSCALTLCTHKPDRVSFAKQRQVFAKAFSEEMRMAEAFVKANPGKKKA